LVTQRAAARQGFPLPKRGFSRIQGCPARPIENAWRKSIPSFAVSVRLFGCRTGAAPTAGLSPPETTSIAMNLKITTPSGSNVLCFAGDLDLYNVDAAREALLHHFADRPGLELDLAAVSTCDAAGMQLLMAAGRSAVELGKSFVIHRPAPAVEKCGELLGLPPETRSPRAN